MTTLAANIGATDDSIRINAPVSGPAPYYKIDSEVVRVLAYYVVESEGPSPSRVLNPLHWVVQRGAARTTKASHTSGAALTPLYPEIGSNPIDTGGGGLPTYDSRASYSGSPVNVANDNVAETPLTWDSLGSGVELFDRTDPERPTVIEAGIYAISASVQCAEFLTDGGMFRVTLHLDLLGDDSVSEMNGGAQWTGVHDLAALISVQNTYYIPADGAVEVRVFNRDGAATRGFYLREALVQRLS